MAVNHGGRYVAVAKDFFYDSNRDSTLDHFPDFIHLWGEDGLVCWIWRIFWKSALQCLIIIRA